MIYFNILEVFDDVEYLKTHLKRDKINSYFTYKQNISACNKIKE